MIICCSSGELFLIEISWLKLPICMGSKISSTDVLSPTANVVGIVSGKDNADASRTSSSITNSADPVLVSVILVVLVSVIGTLP